MKTNKTAFQDYFTPKKRIESLGITASQTLTTPNLNMDYDLFTQQLLAAANVPIARDEPTTRGEKVVTLTAPAVLKVDSMPGSLSTAPRSNIQAKEDQVTRSTVPTAIHQMFQEDQSTSEEETKGSPANGPIVASHSSAAREQGIDAMPLGDIVDLETEAGDAIVTRWLESIAPREKPSANTSAMNKEQQSKERKKKTDREWREKKAQKQKAQKSKAQNAKAQKSEAQNAKVQRAKPQETPQMNEEQQRKERKRISNRNWYQRKKAAQEAMGLQQGAGKATAAKKAVTASKKTPNTVVPKATATKATSTKVTAPKSTLSKASPKNPALKAVIAKTTAPKATTSETKVSKTTASSDPAPAPKKAVSAKRAKPTTPYRRITKRKFGMFQSWSPNDVVVLSDSDSNDDESNIVKPSASQNLKESNNLNAYPSPKLTATKSKDTQRNRSAVKDTRKVVGDRGTRPAQQRGQHRESESQNFLAGTIVQSWLAAVEEEPSSRRELHHVLIPGHGKADNGSDTDSVLGREMVVRDLGINPVVEPVQGTRGGHGSAGLSHNKMESGGPIRGLGPATRTILRSSTKRERDEEDGNDTVRQSKRLKSRREVVVLIDDKVDVSSYESFD